MKQSRALLSAATGRIVAFGDGDRGGRMRCPIRPGADAQSADLVLCDRLAADPADPDKPADVKGAADVASSDIATAIKFCKIASGSSRRALYQLGRAYAANRQTAGSDRRLAQGGRQGLDLGDGRTRRALWHRLGRRQGRGAGAQTVRARGRGRQSARRQQSRGARRRGGAAASDPARARELLAKAARDQCGGAVSARPDAGGRHRRAEGRCRRAQPVREGGRAKSSPVRWSGWARSRRKAAAGRRIPTPPRPITSGPPTLGDEDAKKALKRLECPYVIKDKRGNLVTNLCF